MVGKISVLEILKLLAREGLRVRRGRYAVSSCNVPNPDNPPRLPAGFQRDESLDDE
jgi:hypothetical protein